PHGSAPATTRRQSVAACRRPGCGPAAANPDQNARSPGNYCGDRKSPPVRRPGLRGPDRGCCRCRARGGRSEASTPLSDLSGDEEGRRGWSCGGDPVITHPLLLAWLPLQGKGENRKSKTGASEHDSVEDLQAKASLAG